MKSKKKKMKGGVLRRNNSCGSMTTPEILNGDIYKSLNSPKMSCTSECSSNNPPMYNNFNWNNTSCCIGMGGLGTTVGYNYIPVLIPYCGALSGAATGCLFGTVLGYDLGFGHSTRKNNRFNSQHTCSSYPRPDACFNLY